MKLFARIPVAFGAAAAGLLLSAAPALAHVSASPDEAPAAGYTFHMFRVPHGCDGSPTTKMAISIPDGVASVKPLEVAGWRIDMAMGPITPYDNHGETISEGVKEVSWTGGPLPDDRVQQFGLSMKMPDKAGETVYFPVVQTCQKGVTRWIDIPVAGQDEPEHPAVGVKLVAAEGDDHAAPAAAETKSDAAPVAEKQAGEVESKDDNTLAVVALAIGVLGVLLGGASFFRKRS
jgi:periplasmic copper chaperone A